VKEKKTLTKLLQKYCGKIRGTTIVRTKFVRANLVRTKRVRAKRFQVCM
jgi:hypothetical protein